MMPRIFIVALSLSLFLTVALNAQEPTPETFLVPGTQYQLMRNTPDEQADAWIVKARRKLRIDAQRALQFGPWSVMDKPDLQIAPSGDKHDLVSYSEYWWKQPDGTWELRDGKKNPEMFASDVQGLYKLYSNVQLLGTAGYILDEPAFHEHAAMLLRTWFLNPDTRMNPNLNYSAAIPGKALGRSFGLHRLKKLPEMFDMIALLRTTGAWTSQDDEGMRKWTRQYLDWALTSDFGKAQRVARNNHSVYYAYHVVGCALYLDDQAVLDDILGDHFRTVLLKQIAADGTMPIELGRSKPMAYSVYNFTAMLLLAELAQAADVDLYAVQGADGQSIATAATTMLDYLEGRRTWPETDEPALKRYELLPAMRMAARRFDQPGFETYLRSQFPDWPDDFHCLWWPPMAN